MSERAPASYDLERTIDADATDAEHSQVLGRAREDGFLTAAVLAATANITGAATNNRQLEIVNKGADGNGTTVMATLVFASGTNALDFDEVAFTLSEVEDALAVSEGDIIAVESEAPGTGLAFPGGTVRATFSRHEA